MHHIKKLAHIKRSTHNLMTLTHHIKKLLHHIIRNIHNIVRLCYHIIRPCHHIKNKLQYIKKKAHDIIKFTHYIMSRIQNIPDKKKRKKKKKKKRNAYSKTYLFFLKDWKCYNNFIYIILKACHLLLHCTSFVSRSQNCAQENWLQTRYGSICKVTEKMCLCDVLSQDKINQCESPLWT